MIELTKEEFLTTIKKKRFIVLMPLLFIGAIIAVVMQKNDYLNDLTFIFRMQKYMNLVFNPLAGSILLITVHRKKYTRNSIIQAEEHNVKRSVAVLSRHLAGSLILICLYFLMAALALLLSVIFGTKCSALQLQQLATYIFLDCFAAVTTYVGVLFWQYLFAFPVVPILVYVAAMFVSPLFFDLLGYSNVIFKVCSYVFPKNMTDIMYTGILMNNFSWVPLIVMISHIVLPPIFTILVFKLKKKDKKKKKKKGEEEEQRPSFEELEKDPLIASILREAELTEDFTNDL